MSAAQLGTNPDPKLFIGWCCERHHVIEALDAIGDVIAEWGKPFPSTVDSDARDLAALHDIRAILRAIDSD